MITKQDLQRIASKNRIKDLAFMEKDYALTWVLKAIYSNQKLSEILAFKGGTCISKIYAENYRLSEDLDFSIYKNQQLTLEELVKELGKSFEQVKEEGSPELSVKNYEQQSNQGYLSVKIKYLGPLAHPGEIKFEVSLKEQVLYAFEHLPLKDQNYEDVGEFKIHCYSIYEIISEKVRAIMQRGKSRDYYDVWMLTTKEEFKRKMLMDAPKIMRLVSEKCEKNNIDFEPELIFDESRINEAKNYWNDALGRMVSELPDFEKVIKELKEEFFVVDELNLFSHDLEVEHLDNINRHHETQPLLLRASQLIEKKLDSKKKSEVLKAIKTCTEIVKHQQYTGVLSHLTRIFMKLQKDRDKDIKQAAEQFMHLIRK
ncbi:MAG: hypothetical protein COV47_03060 [Candidatus Diapherotrites archaeon CG11_big_fil_rev_8_21_14_0_20_37_9]|nr:MAG: hypothetical protein COV47_03060 [Candidatus Diapherotrites archaeon CG11_big_fil_rev_8_21_14_0_20_37_9]